MKLFKYNIDLSTFFQPSTKLILDDFGVYLITGYQGTGKSWLGIYLTNKLKDRKIVYTNIHSLSMPNKDIRYFTTLSEITSNIEENCIFLIDEISKKYTKESRQDKEFYSWLQQSRKRKRVVFLITQEYLQVPIWLRGIARYVYTTKKKPFNIFVTYKGLPVLNENMEWTIEPQDIFVYKRTRKISNMYDTMEPINIL